MKASPLFPDIPRYAPLKELLGFVPYSVINPWVYPDLVRRDNYLRDLIDDQGQNRVGVLRGSGKPGAIHTGGVSVFSPLITEILLQFYAPPPPASILDPFAGGGTRAIIAGLQGYVYDGIELRIQEAERVCAHVKTLELDDRVLIVTGDSTLGPQVLPAADAVGPGAGEYDFLLTGPPYWNLERYGGGPADL